MSKNNVYKMTKVYIKLCHEKRSKQKFYLYSISVNCKANHCNKLILRSSTERQ